MAYISVLFDFSIVLVFSFVAGPHTFAQRWFKFLATFVLSMMRDDFCKMARQFGL